MNTVAVEYDLFGVIQSALNAVCSRPNVLFEMLTTRQTLAGVPKRDVALSYALAPPLGALAVAPCAAAGLCRAGATLTSWSCPLCSNAAPDRFASGWREAAVVGKPRSTAPPHRGLAACCVNMRSCVLNPAVMP